MTLQAGGTIRLYALGDARIETPVSIIEPSAELAFATALYFVLEKKEPVSRRALERLLWPNIDAKTASHRLRQTLVKLRKLGVPVETSGTARLRIPPGLSSVDVEDLIATPRQIERVAASHLVVLPHYEPDVSDAFTDWLESKKRAIGLQLATPLLTIISRHRLRANWEEVESWASALLRIVPHNEEATLALAEAHAMRGAKLEGVRILDGYLAEIGEGGADLRLPATVMRKRIADRMPPRPNQGAADAPIIGRGDTINMLSEMLPLVRARSGQSCLVYGDAGIGKSRVFAEFANFASLQGLTCARVQCRPNDSFRPLSIFVDLVPQLRAMRGAIGCSPETMKNLDRLTTHSQGPLSSISLQGDAQFAYAKIQMAVADLIDAVSDESPILMLIEDVHRLDDASAALLTELIPWSNDKRILFGFTSRTGTSRFVESLEQHIRRIRLEPLNDESSREVIVGMVEQSGGTIPDDYLARCIRIAEGNPYFLTELANHWVQTGERQGAPPSLTAVIEQRLSMLNQPALQLLQACALLEKNATLERVEKTLSYPSHQLLTSMSELSSLGMIVLESSDAAFEQTVRLTPRHELLANAAENRLAPPAKAFLHRRIGIVLEYETADRNSSAVLWDCAKHWRHAGNVDRAFDVAKSCATHLMELGLCSEAAQAYEKAFAFCTSDAQRLEIIQGQAHAYFRASDWQNLTTAAAKAREFQNSSSPIPVAHDDVELMEFRASWQRGEQAAITQKTLACLQCQDATLDHRCRAGIMALMLLDLSCNIEAMRQTYDFLRTLVEDPQADPSHRFEAGIVFESVCGDLTAVLPCAQELIAARRKSESIADLIRALTNSATAVRTAGYFLEARQWLHEAIDIANLHKLPLATEPAIQVLASMALDENNADEAKACHDKLLALPRSSFNTESKLVKDYIELRIALSERNSAQIRRLARTDLHNLMSDPIAYSRTYGLALVIAAQMATKEELDLSVLRALEHSHLRSRRYPRQGFAAMVLVSALKQVGKGKRAAQLLREYVGECRREPWPAPLHLLELFTSVPATSARD